MKDAGIIESKIADRLCTENLGTEQFRVGRIWFCFFPPLRGGQSGIERFFRFWGGEALYGLHEIDPETGPILRRVGVPCVIEADVPVVALRKHSFLPMKIARKFPIERGFETGEPTEHEDPALAPIPAANIRRIIRYPDQEFCALTGCLTWKTPLA